ncbi:SusD/RagB family nutrient-binding outer membrane lipoprotein [Puia dinghuensis]|nr:SusD/RagB family nutrient-binding outer membrane lipoprotein [Puia dinghuensis]
MKKNLIFWIALTAVIVVTGTGCEKGDLLSNPNVASQTSVVPVSLILNHMTYSLYAGGGVVDSRPGSYNETPWDQLYIWQQYYVSNYPYYRGNNFYNWSVSATEYDLLKYAGLLGSQAYRQFSNYTNKYYGLAKFFQAYSLIWYTQRVGDIPAKQAGNPTAYPTPTYNSQHDVYQYALALLDSANTILGAYNALPTTKPGAAFDASGDIFGLTNLQWQKVVNTYRLRVLVSLSKRATDNADLNIPQQFATILANPSQYPVMTSNSDNMVFKYNAAFNQYPIFLHGWAPYNGYANICNTYLNLTTSTKDPRTFVTATPAPGQIKAGKLVGDFTAYVGADISTAIGTIQTNSANSGMYSFANYSRYYTSSSAANAEPFILIGYPELCFNIAEGLNRGWSTTGTAATWYTNGIKASLSNYGLSQGQTLTIGDVGGTTLGTVTVDINTFLTNVAYAGNNNAGLTQILQQKYVAFFNNSGWEAYYNWRRTGIPAFSQGGAGIGTPSNLIPRRFQYGSDEALANTTNNKAAIQSQYGGTDDISQNMWLVK